VWRVHPPSRVRRRPQRRTGGVRLPSRHDLLRCDYGSLVVHRRGDITGTQAEPLALEQICSSNGTIGFWLVIPTSCALAAGVSESVRSTRCGTPSRSRLGSQACEAHCGTGREENRQARRELLARAGAPPRGSTAGQFEAQLQSPKKYAGH
jgi:hypothetical protein